MKYADLILHSMNCYDLLLNFPSKFEEMADFTEILFRKGGN